MDTEAEVSPVDSEPVDAPEQHSESAPADDISREPPQQQQYTPWDAFKRLPEFQGADDRAIAARLYNAMEREKAASHKLTQYQQLLPYAQEYLHHRKDFDEFRQHRGDFDQWRQGRQQPSQAQIAQQVQQSQQPQQSSFFQPPKVRDAYRRYLVKDESGRTVISDDAPLDARHELMEYQQARADFAEKFLDNPAETLGPMLQEMAASQAEQIVQQQFQRHEQEQFVSNVEQTNSDWLFDKETGNVTPEGLLVHKYIEQARESGIHGPQARWDYAVAMTERDLLARAFDEGQLQGQQPSPISQSIQQFLEQPQQAPPAAAPEPAKPDLAKQNMEYLRREASRNPSRSAGTATNDPRVSKPKMTFEQMLREDASSRGFLS